MSVTARGGYQIVDFKNVVLTTSGVVIPGIYEQAINCANKPVQATNMTFDIQGTIQHMNMAPFITCIIADDIVTAVIDIIETHLFVTILNDDTVTYQVMS